MQIKLINDQSVANYLISLSNSKLIKKSINQYPVFDSSVSVTKLCEQLISKVSGVYFFHDVRGIHYIGETTNLRSRFISHMTREKNKKLKKAILTAFGDMKFSWVKTSSKMEALILQKKYIRMFKPKCNEIFYKNN